MGIVQDATEQCVHVFVCAHAKVHVSTWLGGFGCVFLCMNMTSLMQVGNSPLTFHPVKPRPLSDYFNKCLHCYVKNVGAAFPPPFISAPHLSIMLLFCKVCFVI